MYGYPTRPTLPQNLALSGNLSIHDADDGGSNGHQNGEVQLEDAPPRLAGENYTSGLSGSSGLRL